MMPIIHLTWIIPVSIVVGAILMVLTVAAGKNKRD